MAEHQPVRPQSDDMPPVVAEVVRNGFVESVHRGSIVVVERDGRRSFVVGDPSAPTLPRSSNKPLQALAMVRLGLNLPADLLALVCASHSGEPFHAEGAERLLARYGLTEADLQNIPDLPVDDEVRASWLRAGRAPSRLVQNCSGKHAGMLATCVINGWDLKTYRDANHPLQRHISETMGDIASERVSAITVDGCGAPAMALSLDGLARAFGRLAGADPATPEGRVTASIRAHPEMVGGTRRDVTQLIRGTAGLIAKDGAEAVYAAGLSDGRGIALKIADGGQRARPVVMAAILERLGIDSSAVESLKSAPVLGHDQPVGCIRAANV